MAASKFDGEFQDPESTDRVSNPDKLDELIHGHQDISVGSKNIGLHIVMTIVLLLDTLDGKNWLIWG